MCGIAGYLTTTLRDDLSVALRRMASSLAHRGPDGEGFFEAQADNGASRVGLAHRRLAIIDLTTGQQPMGNEDGSIQIVFNGEVYNFQQLREQLLARGHLFRTRSDTETVVHAYEEWGPECVTRLRGMFAFAIWDKNRERLFIARDRYGKKPLFMYERSGLLLFASEIKAILAFPGFKTSVDQAAVWEYFSYRYVPAPATLFAGIRKLMPGSYLVAEAGTVTETRYFWPADRKALWGSAPSADPVEDFLQRLDEAVRIRMISDVPFGAFLSGGIDSSAIVGLMSGHSSLPIKTFSAGFTEAAYSELGYARTIAQYFETDHHELTVSQHDLMQHLPTLVRSRDAPVSEPSDIPIYLLSVEASRTVKMVLTGEGSDEFLGGYPKHILERCVRAYQWCPEAVRGGLFVPMSRLLPYGFRRVKTAVVNLGLSDSTERLPRWFGALTHSERRHLLAVPEPPCQRALEIQFDTEPGNSPLRRILYFDQTSWLPDNLLERGDRTTMAASIEARMPFMDHELAAFMSDLSDDWRVRGRTTKRILRESMLRLLPAEILARPKVGFRAPVNEWFRTSMKQYLSDHLLGSGSATHAYYQPQTLRRFFDEHMAGRQNHEKLLWTMLNLEIWHKEYGVSA